MGVEPPDKAVTALVETACETFKKVVYPIMATTEGTGRLIEARFNRRLAEEEKINISDAFGGANKKVDKSSREAKWQPKLKIICDAMEETAIQTETTIRELWENLIANELMDSSVHPEIVNILKRMDASDAFLLRRIANQDKSAEGRHALEGKLQRAEREIAGLQVRRWGGKGKPPTMKGIDKQLGDALKEKEELTGALGNLDQLREQGDDFSYEHLINLGLVNKENDLYRLTQIGNAFVRVVSEPQ